MSWRPCPAACFSATKGTYPIYAQTEAQKVVIDSQAQATKRAQEGYTYAQERGFDVAEKVAENEAVGQFTNMGVGLGTMAGVGGAVGSVVGGAVNNAINAATQPAQPNQTTQPTDDMAAFKAKVEKLTVMKDSGLITEEEFNNMKGKYPDVLNIQGVDNQEWQYSDLCFTEACDELKNRLSNWKYSGEPEMIVLQNSSATLIVFKYS